MGIRALFTGHPASIGESYIEHLTRAANFSVRLHAAGIACLIHAVLPFLFVQTASRIVMQLHERMIAARRTNQHVTGLRPGSALPLPDEMP